MPPWKGVHIDAKLPNIFDGYLSDDSPYLSRIPKSIVDRYAPSQGDCLAELQPGDCDVDSCATWIYDVIDYTVLRDCAVKIRPNTLVLPKQINQRVYSYLNPDLTGFEPAATHIFVF